MNLDSCLTLFPILLRRGNEPYLQVWADTLKRRERIMKDLSQDRLWSDYHITTGEPRMFSVYTLMTSMSVARFHRIPYLHLNLEPLLP